MADLGLLFLGIFLYRGGHQVVGTYIDTTAAPSVAILSARGLPWAACTLIIIGALGLMSRFRWVTILIVVAWAGLWLKDPVVLQNIFAAASP